jgi:outer membrane lipoprotein-sorting protein
MLAVMRAAILALFLRAAAAQTQPEVAEILTKVSANYKTASQYEFEIDGTRNSVAFHTHFAFRAPDKYRMEGAIPGLTAAGSDLGEEGLVVDDGSTLWLYFPKPNQYASMPASALTADAPGDLGDLRPEAMDYFLTWRYRGASDLAGGAKFLREESIDIAGQKIDCYVVTVSPQNHGLTYTWWIEKKTNRILREDDAGNSAVFTSIILGEPIRDELFKFEPPPGARKLHMQQ